MCPAVLCLTCRTVNLLLQLFLGPLFGAHAYLQDMESDHRSQGPVGLWCQQSRARASACLGVNTSSTKVDWPANRQSGLGTGMGHTGRREAAEGLGCWRNKEGSKVSCWRICGVWDWQLSMCVRGTVAQTDRRAPGQNEGLNPVTGKIRNTYTHVFADIQLGHPEKVTG